MNIPGSSHGVGVRNALPMTIRSLIRTIHLWLGLTTGPVILVVALTGCLYAFQEEIQDLTQPYRFATPPGEASLLPPSRLMQVADSANPGKHLHAVLYAFPNRAAQAIYYKRGASYYDLVYLDPYLGKVLKVHNALEGFFPFVLNGHYYLWLPPDVGQPIVATATLLFALLLISGLFLWWPKNKGARKQRFKVKWKGVRWRRKNYDLHTVLGFYALSLALVFALSGLVWGFDWFRDSTYFVASGGEHYEEYDHPCIASTIDSSQALAAIDRVMEEMLRRYPQAEWIEVHPQEASDEAIAANANPDASTYWKADYLYFHPLTLETIEVTHRWGELRKASLADKLFRMNYDIHVGAILGFPGKLLACGISLIIASMPVTGFLIWRGRRKKRK